MKKEVFVNKKYLLIPVKIGAETDCISFFHNEEKIYEFQVPAIKTAGKYEFDYYAVLPVNKWRNEIISVKCECAKEYLESILLSDDLMQNKEKRPIIHFSSDTGWINDPNGLVYHNGQYHMYFQHNPVDVAWGNMSWGHAVSKDLLHWEQRENVFYPDEDGTIFSGSAIVNEQQMLGLSQDAKIVFYTSAGNTSKWSQGKKFVQKAAYSLDGGNTFVKIPEYILGHIEGENRDPKVYWYEKKKLYYMVLFLKGNDFGIFNSFNLKKWFMTQRLTLEGAWECPDLREIPVEGGGSKWMFETADGYYFLGDFDGSQFITDGKRCEAYLTKLPYAAQTMNGTERVITIPWMRTQNENKNYTGMMGIPRQLTLVKRKQKYILRQKLIDEFEQVKDKVADVFLEKQEEFCYKQTEEVAAEVIIKLEKNANFSLNIWGTQCIFNQGILSVGDNKVQIGHVRKLSFLMDRQILEVTIDEGLKTAAYEILNDNLYGDIQVRADENIKVSIFQIR